MSSTTGMPSDVPSRRRPPRSARRTGYLVSVVLNLALLWVVNITPGWGVVPFLTDDFVRVVGFVNVSLLVGVACNLAYVAVDPLWARRLGDAITAAVSLVVLLQLVTVFPFALGTSSGWATILRTGLALACVGTAIAVLANLAHLLHLLVEVPGGQRAEPDPTDARST